LTVRNFLRTRVADLPRFSPCLANELLTFQGSLFYFRSPPCLFPSKKKAATASWHLLQKRSAFLPVLSAPPLFPPLTFPFRLSRFCSIVRKTGWEHEPLRYWVRPFFAVPPSILSPCVLIFLDTAPSLLIMLEIPLMRDRGLLVVFDPLKFLTFRFYSGHSAFLKGCAFCRP